MKVVKYSIRCFVQDEAQPDRFVTCGNNYKQLRELMAEIALGKSVDTLTETVSVTIHLFFVFFGE